jgi:hypothetical protein
MHAYNQSLTYKQKQTDGKKTENKKHTTYYEVN